ncbi:MAG TPA: Ig-like domain-containing protein [Polyangia bacterium]
MQHGAARPGGTIAVNLGPRLMARSVTLLASAAFALVAARPAEAGCAPPQPALHWTHPADGAEDVPTDTGIWILPRAQSLTLNGVALTSANGRLFQPDSLLPNTTYTVEVSSSLPPPTVLRFSFTTGAGPRDIAPPKPPTATSRFLDERPALSPACQAILTGRDCFDTPPYQHLTFDVPERPLFWLIRQLPGPLSQSSSPSSSPSSPSPRQLFEAEWPAACGAPVVFGKINRDDCHELVAFNERGESTTSPPVCTPPAPPPPTSAPPGCHVAPPPHQSPTAALLLASLALLLTAARRRR